MICPTTFTSNSFFEVNKVSLLLSTITKLYLISNVSSNATDRYLFPFNYILSRSGEYRNAICKRHFEHRLVFLLLVQAKCIAYVPIKTRPLRILTHAAEENSEEAAGSGAEELDRPITWNFIRTTCQTHRPKEYFI